MASGLLASSPEFALLLDLRVAIFVALSVHYHHLDGILGRFWWSWAGAKPSSEKNEATKMGISTLPRGELFFIVAREGKALGGQCATVSGGRIVYADNLHSRINWIVGHQAANPDHFPGNLDPDSGRSN